jgi:hypothetical protein
MISMGPFPQIAMAQMRSLSVVVEQSAARIGLKRADGVIKA